MNWLPISFAIVGWLVGALVVLAIRSRELSRGFVVVLLLLSTLGAGAVQYALFTSLRRTERLSGAHLVGVTAIRVKDDAQFIRTYLSNSPEETRKRQVPHSDIDWVDTFKMKAADVSATLQAIEGNVFIRDNYSVWGADLDFRRDQLARLAKRVTAAQDGEPRQETLTTYLACLDGTAKLLAHLEVEMKFRSPKAYYGSRRYDVGDDDA